MFRYEKDMIPVLIENLSRTYKTKYITTEFSTGNGIADLVLTTSLNDQPLVLNDYGMMSLFVKLLTFGKSLNKEQIINASTDKKLISKLLIYLECQNYITFQGDKFKHTKKYKPHTKNLISIEAKLKDWKSGFYQALRYKFFSHKTFLAYPQQYIHRVDLQLLKDHNIGLIAVDQDGLNFIYDPKVENPTDITSYFFLSETFAKSFRGMA